MPCLLLGSFSCFDPALRVATNRSPFGTFDETHNPKMEFAAMACEARRSTPEWLVSGSTRGKGQMALGQKPAPPVNILIPTKIGSKMGGAPIPKWDPIGFDPQPDVSAGCGTAEVFDPAEKDPHTRGRLGLWAASRSRGRGAEGMMLTKVHWMALAAWRFEWVG